jgi:hypothetical protein
VAYGINKSVVAHPAQRPIIESEVRSQATMFEAHIAALFFDYLRSEVPGSYASPDKNSTPVPRPLEDRTPGDAVDYLFTSLTPLFEPIIMACSEIKSPVQSEGDEDRASAGATAVFNQYCQKKGVEPVYTFFPITSRWGCTLTAVIGDVEHTADAERGTKKAAAAVAAYLIFKELGLMT